MSEIEKAMAWARLTKLTNPIDRELSPEHYINPPAAVLAAEIERLRGILNTPLLDDFFEAVKREAAHQVERWGQGHDAGKTPEDWLWVIAYLATKAAQAARYGDRDIYLHHIVTTAAACANWHRHAKAAEAGGGAK